MIPSVGSKMWLLVVVAMVASKGASGQVLGIGKCPEQAVQHNFDFNKYAGDWYEYANYFTFFEIDSRCNLASWVQEGSHNYHVKFTGIGVGEIPRISEAEVTPEDSTNNEPKFIFDFIGNPSSFVSRYWVLDTDYENYSVSWVCSEFGALNSQILWVLTRDRIPDQATVDKAWEIVRERGLDESHLVMTDQHNC